MKIAVKAKRSGVPTVLFAGMNVGAEHFVVYVSSWRQCDWYSDLADISQSLSHISSLYGVRSSLAAITLTEEAALPNISSLFSLCLHPIPFRPFIVFSIQMFITFIQFCLFGCNYCNRIVGELVLKYLEKTPVTKVFVAIHNKLKS